MNLSCSSDSSAQFPAPPEPFEAEVVTEFAPTPELEARKMEVNLLAIIVGLSISVVLLCCFVLIVLIAIKRKQN